MTRMDSRGVGICLGAAGAVIALVRSHPPRLVALASVSWPYGLLPQPGPESGPAAVARRMLVRARRQLTLPQWCPVSVVIGPSLSDHVAEDVLAASAGLLARARLSQARVTATERAWALRREVTVATGALAAAAAGDEAGLAIGAALASLALPHAANPAVAPTAVTAEAPAIVTVPMAAPLLVPAMKVGHAGWALQRIGDVEEPAGYAMTSHRER